MSLTLVCAIGWSHGLAAENKTGAAPPQSPDFQSGEDFTQLNLEQLMAVKVPMVYGASKHEQKATEAPSSVSIVTQGEIQRFGHRTLADILRSVRDFYVTSDRNYGYIGVRGFNRPGDFGGRVLILVDGQRLNEPLYDSAFNLTDFILDVDLIDRVEVIRGPGSSLYGNNAFFAVINVITRRGHDVQGAEVSGAAGTFDTYQGRFTYGNRFTNGLELLLSGSIYNSEGPDRLFFKEYNQPANNDGIAQERDGDQSHSFLGTLSWKDFTLQGAYVSREKQVPTGAFGTIFNDPRFHTVDTRSYVNLTWAHEFAHDLAMKARLYYDYYRYNADYPYAGVNPGEPSVLNRDRAVAEWMGEDVQVTKTVLDKHRLTLGGEFREDFRLDQANFDVEPRADYLDSRRDAYSFGLYAQDEYAILTNLILNAGVRYDHFSTFGDTANPRAALIYSPWTKTTFKLLYGQAFRAPNDNELFYSGVFQKTNPSLKPERIRSYEFVYEQELPANHRFTLSGFYNQIEDLISQARDPSDGLIFYRNIESAETKGISVGLEGRYAGGWLARASYTLQRTEDTDTGEELSNSPRHLAKFNLLAPLYRDKIFTGIEVQYSSSVKTLAGRQAGEYYLVNWTLFSQKLVKGLELSASIYNLFDRKYGFPGAEEHVPVDVIAQDGRSFRVKLTYRF